MAHTGGRSVLGGTRSVFGAYAVTATGLCLSASAQPILRGGDRTAMAAQGTCGARARARCPCSAERGILSPLGFAPMCRVKRGSNNVHWSQANLGISGKWLQCMTDDATVWRLSKQPR